MNCNNNLFQDSISFVASSGPFSGSIKGIEYLHSLGFDYIVTKTITYETNYISGSISNINGLIFNRDGFSNIDVSDWLETLGHSSLLDYIIVSVFAKQVNELVKIAKQMESNGVKYIEFCSSCPTFDSEPLCFSKDKLFEYCKALADEVNIPIIVKLLLTTDKNKNCEMVETVKKSGCHAVSVSDCLPVIDVDDTGQLVKKGMTGAFMKYLVMKFLNDTKGISIPKIAIGGISSSEDCIKYFNLGAIGVGLCSSMYTRGSDCVADIINITKKDSSEV